MQNTVFKQPGKHQEEIQGAGGASEMTFAKLKLQKTVLGVGVSQKIQRSLQEI